MRDGRVGTWIGERALNIQEAQTVALAGCGAPNCLRLIRGAPRLCERCNALVVRLLASRSDGSYPLVEAKS